MKKMKVSFIALILIVSMLSLVGCGSTDKANDGASEGAKEGKTYIVATDATFPPFESTLPSGEIVGFDIDLIKAIADVQGFKVNVQHVGFDPMMKAIESGKADIAIAGITVNDERKAKYDFTESYFDATQLILVPEDSTVKSVDDLKDKNVGFQSATTGEQAAQKLFGKDYEGLKAYDDLPMAVNDLFTGRITAVIGDNAVVSEFVKKSPSKKLKTVKDERFEVEHYGIMVKKGNAELQKQLDEGLKKIKENGTYKEIWGKYFAE